MKTDSSSMIQIKTFLTTSVNELSNYRLSLYFGDVIFISNIQPKTTEINVIKLIVVV